MSFSPRHDFQTDATGLLIIDFKSAVIVSNPQTAHSASVGLLTFRQAGFQPLPEDLNVTSHANGQHVWLSVARSVAMINIKIGATASSIAIDNDHTDWLTAVTTFGYAPVVVTEGGLLPDATDATLRNEARAGGPLAAIVPLR